MNIRRVWSLIFPTKGGSLLTLVAGAESKDDYVNIGQVPVEHFMAYAQRYPRAHYPEFYESGTILKVSEKNTLSI